MDYRTARNVLGTGATATYTDIKRAYRQRAREVHPDYNKSRGAPTRFSTLVRAYKFLMNYRSPFQVERYKRKGSGFGRGLVRLHILLLGISSLNAATDLQVTAPVAALQCDLETTGAAKLVPGLTTKQLSSNRLPGGKLRILVYGLNQLTIPAGNFAVVDAPVTSVGNVVTANVNGTLSAATIVVGSPPPPPPPAGLTITNISPTTYATASLVVGNAFYVDTTVYTLTSIPSIQAGGLWIKTRHGDRFNTSTGVGFTVNQPVTVYVGYNAQATVLPAWLSGWVNTGAQIIANGITFKVYSKNFPAGQVSLGANLASPASSVSQFMYTITLVSGAPVPPPPAAACADGLDNDQDGKVDLADPGCTSASDNDEFNAPPPPPPVSGPIINITVPAGSCVTVNGVKVAGGLNCP